MNKKITIGKDDLEELKNFWLSIDKCKNDIELNKKDIIIKQLEGDKWAMYLEKLKVDINLLKNNQQILATNLEEAKNLCEGFFIKLGKKYGFEAGRGAIDPLSGVFTPENVN